MHVRFSPAREASRAGLLLIGGVKELSVIRSRQSDRSEVQTAATTDFYIHQGQLIHVLSVPDGRNDARRACCSACLEVCVWR